MCVCSSDLRASACSMCIKASTTDALIFPQTNRGKKKHCAEVSTAGLQTARPKQLDVRWGGGGRAEGRNATPKDELSCFCSLSPLLPLPPPHPHTQRLLRPVERERERRERDSEREEMVTARCRVSPLHVTLATPRASHASGAAENEGLDKQPCRIMIACISSVP